MLVPCSRWRAVDSALRVVSCAVVLAVEPAFSKTLLQSQVRADGLQNPSFRCRSCQCSFFLSILPGLPTRQLSLRSLATRFAFGVTPARFGHALHRGCIRTPLGFLHRDEVAGFRVPANIERLSVIAHNMHSPVRPNRRYCAVATDTHDMWTRRIFLGVIDVRRLFSPQFTDSMCNGAIRLPLSG